MQFERALLLYVGGRHAVSAFTLAGMLGSAASV